MLPGVTVAIAATGDGNTLVQPTGPTNDKGVATGKFSSISPGDHTLSATLNGTAATQTAKVTITAGPPVASNSTAQVGPGTSGAVTTVTVNLKDAAGNSVTGAANKIAVTVSGANTAGGPVSETGGGAYTFSYTPVRSGTDLVAVRVDGVEIPGSPLSSAVAVGAPDPGHTTADVGDGSFFVPPAPFKVTVRDAHDNVIGHGGDAVTISVEGTGGLTVTDVGDGTYTAQFSPSSTGTFAVTITLNGTGIGGGPYSTTISFF